MPIPTLKKLSIPLGWELINWEGNITDYFSPTSMNIMSYEPDLVDELAFLVSRCSYEGLVDTDVIVNIILLVHLVCC